MADKEIVIKVDSNIKSVAKDQKEWNKEIGQTKKQIEGVNEEGKEVVAEMQILGFSINGLKTAWSSAAKGAKFLFSSIKMGIASTGVGLLVIAFGTLATWFTKTKVGAEALSVIFKGVGAAVNVIVDRIAKFGGGLAKILSGNVKAGLKDMASSFKNIGTEIQTDTLLTMAFEKQLQNVTDRERELNVEAAKRRADIEEYKLIAEDVTKTEEERLDAAEKAFDIENNLLTSRIGNAEKALELETARLRLILDPSAEQLDHLAQLEINLANIRGESTTKQIELNNKINAIEAETAAKRKEAHDKRMQQIEDEKQAALDAAKAIEDAEVLRADGFEQRVERINALTKENTLNQIDDALEREATKLDIEREAQLNSIAFQAKTDEEKALLDEQFRLKQEAIRKKFEQEEVDDAKAVQKAKDDIRDANIDNVAAGIGLLKQFAGENKALMGAAVVAENIAGVAKTVINTQAANAAATLKYAALPGGVALAQAEKTANNISAGISIATSVAATAQALSQLGGGGGGGGSTPRLTSTGGGGGTPAPQMMSGAFTLGGGEAPEPVQAFVVTDEMTNSQNQLANIRRRSTL